MDFEQWEQFEYLLMQSSFGNHVLFEREQIKEVFMKSKDEKISMPGISLQKADEIRHLIEELIKKPTLAEKKEYINNLPQNSRELIIRAYFNILDNALFHNRATVQ